MEYSKVEEKFNLYTEKCKKIIKDTFFKEEDLEDIQLNEELGIQQTIEKHRLHMIDIKLEHTMRMIEQIIIINEKLGLKFDFKLVMQVAILYHDIGRFSQATWSNKYGDKIYEEKNKPFKHHGEEGEYIFKNNNFEIDQKYIPIIGESIKHHVDLEKTPHLQYRYDKDIRTININDLITGKIEFNEAERQVASLITQLVTDIDKTDILYQHLTDDFDMIRDYVADHSKDTLDNIANYWGVSKSEIIEYNKIDELTYKPRSIRIPIKNMDISKLEVPPYMKEMFYNNTYPELSELQEDRHWHFITILWWRLSHFLNNINFYSVLVNIEEYNLLRKMEAKVPANLKPLTNEAFEYAEEVLVYRTLKENKDNVYITRR